MTRRMRWLAAAAAAGGLVCGLAVLTVRSEWFASAVRQRLVDELERATGGRAELESFSFDWRTMQAAMGGLVLHGREKPTEEPLLRIGAVRVRLKLVSALRQKVDVLGVEIDEPRISLRRDAQGRWNLPPSPGSSNRNAVQRLIDLSAGHFRVSRGTFRFEENVIPLDFAVENLDLALSFAAASHAYRGRWNCERLELRAPVRSPVAFRSSGAVQLDAAGASFEDVEAGTPGGSQLAAQGRLENWESPRVSVLTEGTVAVAEVAASMALPVDRKGRVVFRADWRWDGKWSATGTVRAQEIGARIRNIPLTGLAAGAAWDLAGGTLKLTGLEAGNAAGRFAGSARIEDWRRFQVEGMIADVNLPWLYENFQGKALPWRATASGPVRLEGTFGGGLTAATAEVTLSPADDSRPVTGSIALTWDGMALRFAPSQVALPASRITFAGSPVTAITAGVYSTDLDELQALAALAGGEAGERPPVQLRQSALEFEGEWRSEGPRGELKGTLTTGPLVAYGRRLEGIQTGLRLTESNLTLRKLRVRAAESTLEGDLTTDLSNGHLEPESNLRGSFSLRTMRMRSLLGLAGVEADLDGTAAATAEVSGTAGNPVVSGKFDGTDLRLAGELVERLQAVYHGSRHRLEISSIHLQRGSGTAKGSATYAAARQDWSDGEVSFRGSGAGFRLSDWETVRSRSTLLDGRLEFEGSGSIRIVGGEPKLASLQGTARAPSLSLGGKPLGSASAQARTTGSLMTADVSAHIRNTDLRGGAEWTLTGNSFGLGYLRTSNLTLEALRDVGLIGQPGQELPVRGMIEAEVGFSGPVLEPESWSAAAKITKIELEPNPAAGYGSGDLSRFRLHNQEPLLGYIDRKGLTIPTARFVGEATDLEVGGSFGFRTQNPWNVRLKGRFNLPGLSVIEPDLIATGVSTVDAAVRGSLAHPQISGRMELKDATFYLRGVPNGLEKVTGVMRFDRNRATVERLTAVTGGGDLTLGGFVGFGGDQLVYRLLATAQKVRVRYPESVSTTLDASVNLTGTSAQSLLTGNVTVQRIALTPKTDFVSVLAETARPQQAAAPNAFLRGMQIDLRVQTGANAELKTSLARDIEPEADLRLRGSAAKPSVIGRVSVHDGELQVLGSRYTITRGDVGFFNPSRVEPVLNFDLETRIRGIIVTINLTGPLGKLNFSYRSDPPLQSNEIIALLTVGRDPGQGLAAPQSLGFQQLGGNSLLGAAMSAPVSGRLERFFGVSRIKIDPELNTVTNTPQARLTVEQQLSREVTVTYIANLNRTQNQIIRLQWDFSRDFSVLAVRDENGLFGVDFQYRKRFK